MMSFSPPPWPSSLAGEDQGGGYDTQQEAYATTNDYYDISPASHIRFAPTAKYDITFNRKMCHTLVYLLSLTKKNGEIYCHAQSY